MQKIKHLSTHLVMCFQDGRERSVHPTLKSLSSQMQSEMVSETRQI